MESWLEDLPNFKNEYEIKGYLDNDSKSLQNKPTDYEIVGTHEEMEFKENDYVVIAISNSKVRKRIAESLINKVNFFTYIAPNVTIGKFTKIGSGSIICSNCFISTNTVIGDFVIVNAGSNIGHDCIIESYCSLMANVDIGGSVILGEGVFIALSACLLILFLMLGGGHLATKGWFESEKAALRPDFGNKECGLYEILQWRARLL